MQAPAGIQMICQKPIASVVVPTRNRWAALHDCLDSLAAQSMPVGSFEVVVVDDGSEPPLKLDPLRWESKFSLKLVRQANTGPAGARNRGVAEAAGEFLAFTDDDTLPKPNWLPVLVSALRANPEALVGGSTFNGLRNDLFAETSMLVLDLVYAHFNADPGNVTFFASNNLGSRRDRFLACGGFDPRFVLAAEDREFCDRWRMQNRPLIWEQRAVVEHRHPQSFWAFCRLHFRYGIGAFRYQVVRRERKSGTMKMDLGFHRQLPAAVARLIRQRSWPMRLAIGWRLVLWEAVNAAGFAAAWSRAQLPWLKGPPHKPIIG
ncbi:MAG: glycosyltransferase family A protein [Verrucomicrobiota bacterium]